MPHNILSVAVPNMNADHAERRKVLTEDGINPCLHFGSRLDAPKDLSFSLLIAAPHQAGVTHNCICIAILPALEQLIEFIAFPENLLIRAIGAINSWPIPPCREKWSRK